MAIFTKYIDKGIPAGERRQVVLSSELSTGDIIDVESLLGGTPASRVQITTDGSADLTVRYNVIRMIYPQRGENDGFGTAADLPNQLLGQGSQHIDQSMDAIPVAADLKGEDGKNGPVKSVEVNWTAGTWSMQFFG